MAPISWSGGRLARALPAAYLGLAPVLFFPLQEQAYILPRVGLTLLGAAALVAGGLLRGRSSLGELRLPALAVAAAALAAFAFSVAPSLSLVGEYGWYESLPVRLAYLGLFAGAAWLAEERWAVIAFLLGCTVASLEALAEWPPGPFHLARPDGNLGQANLLGALLAMALPLGLERSLRHPRWLVVVALAGLALVLSGSRSGWLGALVGTATLVVFRVSRRRLHATLMGAALAVAGALAVGLASPLRTLNLDTGAGRLGVWHDTFFLIAARPLTGWGEDTFGIVFGRWQSGDWSPGESFTRAHAMPLDLLAAQGLLGLAACTWFFWVFWRGLWRRPQLAGLAGACAAYWVWALLNFDWAPATGPFWALAGVAWAGTRTGLGSERAWARPRPLPGPGGHSRGRWRVAAAGAALAVGLGLALPDQLADVLLGYGRPDRAVVLNPLQPRYWAALGGPAALEQAERLQDPDPATALALGDALTELGKRQQAKAAYRHALELYPYYGLARERLRSG